MKQCEPKRSHSNKSVAICEQHECAYTTLPDIEATQHITTAAT